MLLVLIVNEDDEESIRCMMWLNWTRANVEPNSLAIPLKVIFRMGRYMGSLNANLENGFMTCFEVKIGPIDRLRAQIKK